MIFLETVAWARDSCKSENESLHIVCPGIREYMKLLELCKFAQYTNTYNRDEVWWQFRYFIYLHVKFSCSIQRAWIIFIASVIQSLDSRAWIRALYTWIIHARMQPCLCTDDGDVLCFCMDFVSVSTSSLFVPHMFGWDAKRPHVYACISNALFSWCTSTLQSIPNACDKRNVNWLEFASNSCTTCCKTRLKN